MPYIGCRVDNETKELFRKKAMEMGVTMSDLLRMIINDFLGRKHVIQRETDVIHDRISRIEKRLNELERMVKKIGGLSLYINK